MKKKNMKKKNMKKKNMKKKNMKKKPCDITVLHCARFFSNMWLDETNACAIYRTI